MRSHPATSLALALATIVILPGCATRPTAPSRESSLLAVPVTGVPAMDSPAHVLDRFQWSMEHRNLVEFATLTSADFRLSCNPRDSAGNNFDQRVGREDLLAILGRAFETGTATTPKASSIAVTWSAWVDVPDPRVGMDPAFHRLIRTQLTLHVVSGGDAIDVADVVDFSFVRGDSAVIPSDLVEGGARADAATWYIDLMGVGPVSAGTAAQVPPVRSASAGTPPPMEDARPQPGPNAARGLTIGWCDWLSRYQ
jgi:hypothetical protein